MSVIPTPDAAPATSASMGRGGFPRCVLVGRGSLNEQLMYLDFLNFSQVSHFTYQLAISYHFPSSLTSHIINNNDLLGPEVDQYGQDDPTAIVRYYFDGPIDVFDL